MHLGHLGLGFQVAGLGVWVSVGGNHLVGGLAPEAEALRHRHHHLPQLRETTGYELFERETAGYEPCERQQVPSPARDSRLRALRARATPPPSATARPTRASSSSHHKTMDAPSEACSGTAASDPGGGQREIRGRARLVAVHVQRFRGGLVFKAHRLLYHSTLGLRVINKKKDRRRSSVSIA